MGLIITQCKVTKCRNFKILTLLTAVKFTEVNNILKFWQKHSLGTWCHQTGVDWSFLSHLQRLESRADQYISNNTTSYRKN